MAKQANRSTPAKKGATQRARTSTKQKRTRTQKATRERPPTHVSDHPEAHLFRTWAGSGFGKVILSVMGFILLVGVILLISRNELTRFRFIMGIVIVVLWAILVTYSLKQHRIDENNEM